MIPMKVRNVNTTGNMGKYSHCHYMLALLYRLKSGMLTESMDKVPTMEVSEEGYIRQPCI